MLVLWSGGCDSTYLLYTLLYDQYVTRGNHKLEPHQTVSTISIIHDRINAAEENKLARNKFIKYTNRLKWTFHNFEVTIASDNGNVCIGENNGLSQPLIWLPIAVNYLRPYEDLYVGYIHGDCVWHYKHEIYAMFDNMQKIRGGTGKLIAPLEWQHKYDILKNLKSYKLHNKVWWCENPVNGKNCKKCVPCITNSIAKTAIDNEIV